MGEKIKIFLNTFWQAWKVKILLAALILNFALLGWAYYKGYTFCEDRVEWRTIEKVIEVKEKQNEIINNKPTVSRVASRLQAGTF
jgi:hypothetical protein